MSRLAELEASLRFCQYGVRDLRSAGSVWPSSRSLARAMVAPFEHAPPRSIVELGTGTGAITRELLRVLHPEGRLYAVESNASLLEATTRRLVDRRLVPLAADASMCDELVRRHPEAPWSEPVDAIVSSLPLTLFTAYQRAQVLETALSMMDGETAFVQFSYLHTVLLGEDLEAWLRERFVWVQRSTVLRALPPARVFVCRVPQWSR